MKATQLPVIINNATTGHKLQGSSVDSLFVHNWSYVANWVYVMLSRVRTRKGLFARCELSTNLSKYSVPEELSRMLRRMASKAPTQLDDHDYQEILNS